MEQIYVLLIVYKIITLLVGSLCCYWGYRLFLSMPVSNAGEISINIPKSQILMRRAAPGAIFLVFGAAVIIAAINSGVSMEKKIYKEPQTTIIPKPELK